MWSFLKWSLATVFGLCLFIFLVIGIGALFMPSGEERISANTILKLTLSGQISERAADDPLAELSGGGARVGLLELKNSLKKAKTDNNIKGIFLQVSFLNTGFASIEEIRNALIDFKKSNKFVIAYSEIYSEGAYYLVSVADKIYLNPRGGLEFNGLTAQRTFFKGSLEKLNVKPEVFRVGDFKSAVEPFLLDKMSEADRKQTSTYLNSIYDFYLQNVAKSRKIPLEELRKISAQYLAQMPEEALKYKLVDKLAFYDEVEAELKNRTGIKADSKLNFVGLGKYSKVPSSEKTPSKDYKIAVIVGEGEIMSGKSGDDNIGSETIAEELRRAREDKNVKAIVLRINSPGGSALASDVMWREVMLTKKVKPVIASMSDVAASGGYYMAMACDAIVAQPNTITGSIGIFGLWLNTENMFRDKLGMTFDRVTTGQFSDIGDPNRSLTDTERKMIQRLIEDGYADFTRKAAEGRKLPLDSLLRIASGRVWTGADAKARGLVDVLGGFDDAVKLAAERAKLKDGEYRLRYYPAQKTFTEKLSALLGGENAQVQQEKWIKAQLGEHLYPYYQFLCKLKRSGVVQARMPYDIEIK